MTGKCLVYWVVKISLYLLVTYHTFITHLGDYKDKMTNVWEGGQFISIRLGLIFTPDKISAMPLLSLVMEVTS